MKYIGTLNSCIHHTLLLFNTASLDEVCVQATRLENRGKHVQEDPTKKPSKFPRKQFKGKFQRKDKNTAIVKREEGNPSFTHCKKNGHDDEHCWKLHSDKRPKQFDGKGKTKTISIMQQYIGSDLGDQEKITMVGVQGKFSLHDSTNSNNESHDERKRNDLF
jgi:hypothetical protein